MVEVNEDAMVFGAKSVFLANHAFADAEHRELVFSALDYTASVLRELDAFHLLPEREQWAFVAGMVAGLVAVRRAEDLQQEQNRPPAGEGGVA